MTTTFSPAQFSSVPAPVHRASKLKQALHKRLNKARAKTARPAIALSSKEWARLHLSLGVCQVDAKKWFESAPATLRERYQTALAQQTTSVTSGEYPLLHDPIEDDPRLQAVFEEVEEILAFDFGLDEMEDGPNFCLFLWNEKARLLREEFGIEWFSPAQMNPFVRFA